MREKELNIFLEALFALKNAAAYTAGDLYALLSLCRENAFLGRVWVLSENMDCTAAFKAAAHAFFTYRGDEALCAAFIDGFGKTDLDGQVAYFALHEGRVRSAKPCPERQIVRGAGTVCRRFRRPYFAVTAGKESKAMDVDLIFKIAAIGILVAVLNQLLIRSGREEQAMMTTLAGLIVVLTMLITQISTLFDTIKSVFGL